MTYAMPTSFIISLFLYNYFVNAMSNQTVWNYYPNAKDDEISLKCKQFITSVFNEMYYLRAFYQPCPYVNRKA